MSFKILWVWTSLWKKIVSEAEICECAWLSQWYLNARTELNQVFILDEQQDVIDMFIDAISLTLIDAHLTINDIDWIFVSHSWVHKEKVISLSSLLVSKLKLNKLWKNIIAKDVNSACVWAGDVIDTAIKQLESDHRSYKNYLVASWDSLWSVRDKKDIKTWMFSDGVWCLIITNNPDFYSPYIIRKSRSWMTKWVDESNIFWVSQWEWDYLRMQDGKALSVSLLSTADEIFNILWITKLKDNTLIIPHQPNGRMIDKRSRESNIIENAKKLWKNIHIHKETYQNMWNVSWASTIFWFENVIKKWWLPKGCKKIILMPFGAWGHISWCEIDINTPSSFSKRLNWWDDLLRNRINDLNNLLFSNKSPISYKENLIWRMTFNTINKDLEWFMPINIGLNKLLWEIDMFHRLYLRNNYPNKEFVTISISYQCSSLNKDNHSQSIESTQRLFSWSISINDSVQNWKTKSWKNIYNVSSIKDWVKIITAFCEIDPVEWKDGTYIKYDITDDESVIQINDLNMHWSIWWYVSSSILLSNSIPNMGKIYFLSWGEIWHEIYLTDDSEYWKKYKLPDLLIKKDNLVYLINKTTDKVIAVLEKNYDAQGEYETKIFNEHLSPAVFAWLPL